MILLFYVSSSKFILKPGLRISIWTLHPFHSTFCNCIYVLYDYCVYITVRMYICIYMYKYMYICVCMCICISIFKLYVYIWLCSFNNQLTIFFYYIYWSFFKFISKFPTCNIPGECFNIICSILLHFSFYIYFFQYCLHLIVLYLNNFS